MRPVHHQLGAGLADFAHRGTFLLGQGNADDARNLAQQLVQLYRFGGKAIHAGVMGLHPVLLQHAGGQGNHRRGTQAARLLDAAHAAGRLQPVHAGHLHIHQHHIKVAGLPGRQRLCAVGGHHHLVPGLAQHQLQQLQVLHHIVHHQNAQGRQLVKQYLGRRMDLGTGAQGQAHMEVAALAQRAGDPQRALHQLHQLAGNGGAQAGATKAPAHGGIGLREGVKNFLDAVRGNAAVAHGQVDLAGIVKNIQPDMALGGELDGIAHQVAQHLLHAQGIPLEVLAQADLVVQLQGQALGLGAQAQGVQHLDGQGLQAKVGMLQLQCAFLQLGGVQNIVQQLQQRARRLAHRAHVAALQQAELRAQQHLGEADDGVHGGADFVAHIGQKGGLGGCRQLGPVLGGDQRVLHFTAFLDVQHDAINPKGVALCVIGGGTPAPGPEHMSIAVADAVFDGVAAMLPDGRVNLDQDGCQVGWVNQLFKAFALP